jgi:hypothetical protein
VVGDFNGDGRDDVANYHPALGTWQVSLSSGSALITQLWARFGTRTGWTAQVVGDFNRDGKDDVANYHPAYGTWQVSLSAMVPYGTTFDSGVWRVNSQIPPGTYRNSDSSGGCYWERLSGFSGELGDIIANDFTFSRTIVTISSGDVGFKTEDCGVWTSDLSPIRASATAPLSNGTYFVGSEVAPGTWHNSDSSNGCYWERLSGFSGELGDIIANEFTFSPTIVTIGSGDVGFKTEDCGVWTR